MPNSIVEYQNNLDLNIVKAPAGWQGTPVDQKGRFLNLNHPYLPDWSDFFRWKLQKSPFRQLKKEEVWKPDILKEDRWLSTNDNVIVWLGHSTFYIRINKIKMLFDPIFGGNFSIKRQSDLPVNTSSFVDIDYILLSHDHRDHLDEKSLKLLSRQNPGARYFAGLGMRKIVHSFTLSDNIEEAGWYQQYNTGASAVKITFIPSRHWSARGLNDANQRLWGGFVIEFENKRILFGGDSGYDAHYKQLATVFGGFNYAILGIGAYEPAWFMSPNHQSPNDALKGFKELNADHFIPMHYGTFDLSDEPLSQPLKDLLYAAKEGKLEARLNILAIGEPLLF